MIPLNFTSIDTHDAVEELPILKIHQAIGILNERVGVLEGRDYKVYINSKTGTTEENLILQRVIEANSRELTLSKHEINQIKVKKLDNGNFSIKVEGINDSEVPFSIKFEKTIDDLDDQLQKQVLPFAQEAYNFYKDKLPGIINNLENLFPLLGIVQARAKSPESAANRLMRTLKFTWGPKDKATIFL